MKCPKCESTSYRKNGHRSGKQNYICKNCGRQFLEPSSSPNRDGESYSRNGHTQTSVAEVSELPLVKELSEETETAKRLNSVSTPDEELLQILSPSSLESSAFKQFLEKIQEFTESSAKPEPGISILLLDAENLKLDINIEKFLASLCRYDLQVKIAFANWRNPTMGKQDAELYNRGYQLQHVPEGKDSADGKMIAHGASILRSYPTAKEVFVCSCDRILIHLCNQLQNQGLTVYWVRRQVQSLEVENRNTGQVSYYSIAMQTSIPSFEGLIQKIEALIKAEQKSITERLSKLAIVSTLFQERYNLTSNANRSNNSTEIVQQSEIIRIIKENSTKSQTEKKPVESNTSAATTPTVVDNINSREELEKALIEIIQALKVNSPKVKLSVAKLGTELRKASGQTPNSIVKKLKLGSNFTKFLQSCPTFQLKKIDKEYEVAIAQR